MPWQYIYFNRKVSDTDIKLSFSKLMRISPDSVEIQHEVTNLEKLDEHTLVVCTVFSRKGDFPIAIEVIPLKKSLAPTDIFEAVGQLCSLLDCEALTDYSEQDATPYTFTLIRAVEDYRKVIVDHDLFDMEEEQIKIIEYGKILN